MDTIPSQPAVDQARLEAFAGKAMQDLAGACTALLVYMGDQTGVFRALREVGPAAPEALAARAGVDARYLTEWLCALAAGGYVEYDPATGAFSLSPEQAVVLAEEGHPACVQGYAQIAVAQVATYELAIETFRTGAGRAWDAHDRNCFCGVDRFFRPGYMANLLDAWLPALDGVTERLEAGGKVADVGCGHGAATLLLASAFPRATVHGYDIHGPSIEAARRHAAADGAGNVRFETAAAKELPNEAFDLVCLFDALHDMGDPVGAARRIRECLAPDGVLMLVEPLAGDRIEDNLHLIGQLFYAGSTLICTPASRSQEVGLALGAQAGEARLRSVLLEAGFGRVRRVAETMTNMVLEARP